MKTPEEYLDLPYHIVLVRDEDDDGNAGYVAAVQELPGCLSQGDTPDEAYESAREAMLGWITVALENRREIPEPTSESQCSGRILVRMPRSLHAALIEAANEEGVSVNQFIVGALAAAVSWRATSAPGRTGAIAGR